VALWAVVAEESVAEESVAEESVAAVSQAQVVAVALEQGAAQDPDAPWPAVESADAAVPSRPRC